MKPLNQAQIIAKRRPLNRWLTVIFIILSVWFSIEVFHEFKRLTKHSETLKAQHIRIIRDVNTITLQQQNGAWYITTPYQQTASLAVVDALLERLQHGCRQLAITPVRSPVFYADIIVDQQTYHIGELNTASDEIYVAKGKTLFLCDKLLISMALAPAINFMDKQLYRGTLRAIVGDFGQLTDFSGMDLSVMEIAPADAKALPEHALSSLQFVADDQRRYQAFLHPESTHLLLFEPKQSVIYVIAAHPKLNAVLGL